MLTLSVGSVGFKRFGFEVLGDICGEQGSQFAFLRVGLVGTELCRVGVYYPL